MFVMRNWQKPDEATEAPESCISPAGPIETKDAVFE
jgi:hypothetical protein